MEIIAIQLNSGSDKKQNLLHAEEWITLACQKEKTDLIALPEMFAFMGGTIEEKKKAAEKISEPGEAISLLQKLAKQFQVYIHGGSICEYDSQNYYNTTCVINPSGEIIATYRKINLFKFAGSNAEYHEGAFLSSGNKIITYQVGDITIGCVICFDLRFGDLFQELIKKKVDMIIVPSAFTYETGKAHWETLCRARAIETQSFLIAPAQTGNYHIDQRELACYGHSMIVDPWGTKLVELDEEEGFIRARLDFNFLAEVRKKLPTT